MQRLFALALLPLLACSSAEPASTDELEQFIRDQMRAGGIPGASVAIVDGGEVVWVRTYGFADLDARREIQEDTPFLVASISKTVVSILAMQLVEQGRLQLDDPIDTLLGASVHHPDFADKSITPRMLATHTSGIVDDWITLGAATKSGDSQEPLVEFMREYVGAANHFGPEPGTKHEYSNSAFAALGAVVESAAGEPLPQLSRRAVFDPLEMNDTGWHLSEMNVDALAVPYSGTWRDGFDKSEHQGFAFYPATSLRTSVRDLAKLMISFMHFGVAPGGARILSEDTARGMRELEVPALDDDQAFGWYYEEVAGQRWFGHNGSAIGASAAMYFDPQGDRGVIMLTNSDAFIRSRLGFPEGRDAFYAIFDRLVTCGALCGARP